MAAGAAGRRTGGGGTDPPLPTRTVAKASADAFASGRGGRTAVAAATAEGARGLRKPDSRSPSAAGAAIFTAGTEGGVFARPPLTSLPGGLWLGEVSQAAWVGGGWGVVGREEPGLESAAAAAAALIAPEGPEENPRAARPGAPGLLCVGLSGRGGAARLSAGS